MERLEGIPDGCAECFPFETIEELKRIPLVIREQGSGSLEVFEKALGTRQLKLSQLNIIMQPKVSNGFYTIPTAWGLFPYKPYHRK